MLDSGNVVEEFGPESLTSVESSIDLFDKDAKRYHADTYKSKRSDFLEKLHTFLHVLFLEQLRNIHKHSVKLFNKSLLEGSADDSLDFSARIEAAKDLASDYYTKWSKMSCLENSGWEFDDYTNSFLQEIAELTNQKREDQLAKVASVIEVSFCIMLTWKKSVVADLTDPLASLFAECPDNLWDEVLGSFTSVMFNSNERLSAKIQSIGIGKSLASSKIAELYINGWELLLKLLKDEVADNALFEKLRRRFN